VTQLFLMDRQWVTRQVPIVIKAMASRDFTSDDLRGVVTEQPEQPNLFGVLMAHLRCSGSIVEVGRQRSKRPEANGRKITSWRVV
jgi:hypothetical protein